MLLHCGMWPWLKHQSQVPFNFWLGSTHVFFLVASPMLAIYSISSLLQWLSLSSEMSKQENRSSIHTTVLSNLHLNERQNLHPTMTLPSVSVLPAWMPCQKLMHAARHFMPASDRVRFGCCSQSSLWRSWIICWGTSRYSIACFDFRKSAYLIISGTTNLALIFLSAIWCALNNVGKQADQYLLSVLRPSSVMLMKSNLCMVELASVLITWECLTLTVRDKTVQMFIEVGLFLE